MSVWLAMPKTVVGMNSSPASVVVNCDEILGNVTLNTTGNLTYWCSDHPPRRAGNMIVPLVMFLSGVIGNILALLVLHRVRKSMETKRSVFYILVTGLALTDLFSLVTISPVTLAVYSNDHQWVGGEILCQYDAVCMIAFGLATPLIICSMAIERFLALHCTFFYSRHVNHRKVKLLLCFIWLTSILFAMLPLVGFGQYELQYPGTWCFLNFHAEDHKGDVADVTYSLLFSVITLILIFITIICNMFVVLVLLKMRRTRVNRNNVAQCRHFPQTIRQRELEIQMVWLLVCMTCSFIVFYAPLMTQIIINEVTGLRDHRADLLAIYLACLNQIIDPWIYILLRKSLLTKVVNTCRRFCCSDVTSRLPDSPRRSPKREPVNFKRHVHAAADYSDSTGSARSCKLLINRSDENLNPHRVYYHQLSTSSDRKVKIWRFRKNYQSEPLAYTSQNCNANASAATYPGDNGQNYDIKVIKNQIVCARCDSGIGFLPETASQCIRKSVENAAFMSESEDGRENNKKRRFSSLEGFHARDMKTRRRSKSAS